MNRRSLALAGALALALAGCPHAAGGGDGGAATGGSSGGATGGHGSTGGTGGVDAGRDAGPAACRYDVDCLPKGQRCASDGGCVPAVACDPGQGSSNCASTSYCWTDGIDTTNNCECYPFADGGLCYLQIPPCGACTSSLACGGNEVDNPALCGPVGNGNFCLPLDQTGSCPQGFVFGTADGGVGICVPSCGSCPCSGCLVDADCASPAAGVCNGQGVCQAPCRGPGDCPNGDVCHVLGKYLDPSVGALYGAGKCGPPCAAGGSCAGYQDDAGPPLVCETDDGGSRCRPSGCLSDRECAGTQAGGDASVIPWCDIWNGNLMNGNGCDGTACRIGIDPATALPFQDCIGGYGCELPDGGSPPAPSDAGPPLHGACFQIPCNAVPGGGHNACAAGQLCCGDGDGGTSCGGAAPGACYPAPNPPWCVSCDPNAGTYFNPGCAQGGDGFPGPIACLPASGLGTNPPAYCGSACDVKEEWTCPAGWQCQRQPYLVSQCSACGSASCLDAGQDQNGNPLDQCGCAAQAPCPFVPALYPELASCATCPLQGNTPLCAKAQDDAGYNCLCFPDGGGCPPYDFGGAATPTVCVDTSGNGSGPYACAAGVQTSCEGSVCSLGAACEAQHYGCDAG
ncbi:MAG: hypothetical protein ACYCWW_20575 [Deltaproteobacteria bacterium]